MVFPFVSLLSLYKSQFLVWFKSPIHVAVVARNIPWLKVESLSIYWTSNMAMESGSLISDFPIKTSIDRGFSHCHVWLPKGTWDFPQSNFCWISFCRIKVLWQRSHCPLQPVRSADEANAGDLWAFWTLRKPAHTFTANLSHNSLASWSLNGKHQTSWNPSHLVCKIQLKASDHPKHSPAVTLAFLIATPKYWFI